MRKKGQMEIMGLAVIVVMIVFGLLLYLRFTVTDDVPESIQKEFQRNSIPNYFIQALLDTSIETGECDIEGTFKELATDCVLNDGCGMYSGGQHNPAGTPSISCFSCADPLGGAGSITSCEFLEFHIEETLFRETLEQQGRYFKFILGTDAPATIFEITSPECNEIRAFTEFPLANGERLSLGMCTK